MDKLKQYKIKSKENMIDESILKNASQLKYDKEGRGVEIEVAGHRVTIICDSPLPVVYIAARISELLEDKEKEIKERM